MWLTAPSSLPIYRLGGVQVHIINGKVRTAPSLGEAPELGDGHMNDWVAVAIDDEWRLIDINFAARKSKGGDPGDWELIDDNGKVCTNVAVAGAGMYQRSSGRCKCAPT